MTPAMAVNASWPAVRQTARAQASRAAVAFDVLQIQAEKEGDGEKGTEHGQGGDVAQDEHPVVEQVFDVEKGLRRGEPRLVHAEQHDADSPAPAQNGATAGGTGPYGPHDEGRHAAGKKAEAAQS